MTESPKGVFRMPSIKRCSEVCARVRLKGTVPLMSLAKRKPNVKLCATHHAST